MTCRPVRSLFAALSLQAITCLFLATPVSANDEAADKRQPIAVCPDGGYESGCTQGDVDNAITLANDYLMTMRSRCLYLTEARCWVSASGSISGMERGGPMIWQHMILLPKDGPYTEMMVLAEGTSQENMKLVAANQVFGYFGPPDMVQNSDEGVLIHVSGRRGGSGSGNADFLMVRKKAGWSGIAMDSWMDEVNGSLPDDFEIRQGVQFNFRDMFVISPVWRKSDGNCCATGGIAKIGFRIIDNILTVESLSFDETQPTG